jgi:predicted nucleotidyltransferase
MRNSAFPFLPKDFIQTKEGLIFAVVSYQDHDNKIGCFLRYVPDGDGWLKVDTQQANALLQDSFPQYLYHSNKVDAEFHAVSLQDITHHHQPEQRLNELLQREPKDEIEKKCHKLIPVLQQFGVKIETLGLTGSMLINQQKPSSDIDLVVYGREAFQQTRRAIQQAIESGLVHKLDISLMQDNFERRNSDLGFDEFSWHEDRKFNKAAIENSKFDIGMVCLDNEKEADLDHYQKLGPRTFRAQVIDDKRAFDFPACYLINDDETPVVLSFTHTYVGQAQQGELIEISGMVERNISTGQCRIIVGSSREAQGEYIKVIKR